ncbi:MAG: PA2779 family protein [Kiloniellales bacterium]
MRIGPITDLCASVASRDGKISRRGEDEYKVMRARSLPSYRPAVAWAMAVVMVLASLPVNLAQAAMVTTDQVIEDSTAADDRARVMDFMAREDVRQELQALGVDPDEASRRTASLSDEEIRQIAGRLDELPAGQSGAEVLALVLVLGILFLIGYWFVSAVSTTARYIKLILKEIFELESAVKPSSSESQT